MYYYTNVVLLVFGLRVASLGEGDKLSLDLREHHNIYYSFPPKASCSSQFLKTHCILLNDLRVMINQMSSKNVVFFEHKTCVHLLNILRLET